MELDDPWVTGMSKIFGVDDDLVALRDDRAAGTFQ